MHRRKKTLGLIALLGVFSIIAAACGGGKTNTGATPSTAVGGKAGGVYRSAIEDFGFTGAFDPTGEYLGTAFGFFSQMMIRNLVTYDHILGTAGDKIVPDLATDTGQYDPLCTMLLQAGPSELAVILEMLTTWAHTPSDRFWKVLEPTDENLGGQQLRDAPSTRHTAPAVPQGLVDPGPSLFVLGLGDRPAVRAGPPAGTRPEGIGPGEDLLDGQVITGHCYTSNLSARAASSCPECIPAPGRIRVG